MNSKVSPEIKDGWIKEKPLEDQEGMRLTDKYVRVESRDEIRLYYIKDEDLYLAEATIVGQKSEIVIASKKSEDPYGEELVEIIEKYMSIIDGIRTIIELGTD